MMLASRTSRLGAQMLDSIIAFAPMIAFALLGEAFPAAIEDALLVGAFLFIPGYILFADALPNGQSYGKRALGIAVVSKWNGAPCTAWQSFLRNLTLGILGFFDWVFIFGGRHQRLGDMAAETIVVDAASIVPAAMYAGQETPRAAYDPYAR